MIWSNPGKMVVRRPFFWTRCEHCGWQGSSEVCGEISNGDDADVTCPSCHKVFIADEHPQTG